MQVISVEESQKLIQMSSKQKNLSKHGKLTFANAVKYKIGVVISEYNDEIKSALRKGCIDIFKKYGVKEKNIYVQLARGAYDLPLFAKELDHSKKSDAVISLA